MQNCGRGAVSDRPARLPNTPPAWSNPLISRRTPCQRTVACLCVNKHGLYYNPPAVDPEPRFVNPVSPFRACAVLSREQTFCASSKVFDTPFERGVFALGKATVCRLTPCRRFPDDSSTRPPCRGVSQYERFSCFRRSLGRRQGLQVGYYGGVRNGSKGPGRCCGGRIFGFVVYDPRSSSP